MAVTPNYGWTLPTVGGDADTWGTSMNALLNSVDSQVYANQTKLVQAAPPGTYTLFMGQAAPSGWIKANGATIGSASSGATNRANSDTANLYAVLWANFDNASLPIQNSSGSATTRGANAAADFSANKRLPVPDVRDYFMRAWKDDGTGTGGNIGAAGFDSLTGGTSAKYKPFLGIIKL